MPRLGRILALADAWAAMTAVRPYRRGLTPARAAEEVLAGAGAQFDPELVPVFLGVLVELGIVAALPATLNGRAKSATTPLGPAAEPDGAMPLPVRSTTDRLRPTRG